MPSFVNLFVPVRETESVKRNFFFLFPNKGCIRIQDQETPLNSILFALPCHTSGANETFLS